MNYPHYLTGPRLYTSYAVNSRLPFNSPQKKITLLDLYKYTSRILSTFMHSFKILVYLYFFLPDSELF